MTSILIERDSSSRAAGFTKYATSLGIVSQAGVRFMLALTVARLGLILPLVKVDSATIITVLILTFAVTDMIDGVIARSLELETVVRRITDAYVDRTAIHLVIAMLVLTDSRWAAAWALLAFRDAMLWLCIYSVQRRSRVVMLGGALNRVSGVLTAIWTISAYTGHETIAYIAAAMTLVSAYGILIVYSRFARSEPTREAQGPMAVAVFSVH